MTPEEDKIFGAFSKCPLVPLEVVSNYEYMTHLNLYLKLCSSAVDCTLGCETLGYLVLTAEPAVFNTHCVTKFVVPEKSRHSSGHAWPSSYGRHTVLTRQDAKTWSDSFQRVTRCLPCVQESHFKTNPPEVIQVLLELHHWLREGRKPGNNDAPHFRVRKTRRREYTRD